MLPDTIKQTLTEIYEGPELSPSGINEMTILEPPPSGLATVFSPCKQTQSPCTANTREFSQFPTQRENTFHSTAMNSRELGRF